MRPVEAGDEPFLRSLYASTRHEELAPLGWTPSQLEAFLDMQYRARDAHYRQEYPDADDRLVLADGQPVGRFNVVREPQAILVIDIAMAPAFRGQGIGTGLLLGVIEEASAAGVPAELYVEMGNPARRLYDRLGFVPVGEVPPYFRLQRQPGEAPLSRR